ncbi:uncharacterized protein LOC134223189 [Armigeres subalbatus]|uniref:uncharacterized protein LOC134223189 n=1 Tax=Armigeres subalbatus TaxID=124917 RepID=UPI002ED3B085
MKLVVLSLLVLVGTVHVTSGRLFNPWWPQPAGLPCLNLSDEARPFDGPWWLRFIPRFPLPPCPPPSSNSSDSAAGVNGTLDVHVGNNSLSGSFSSNSSDAGAAASNSSAVNGTDSN